MLAGGFCKLCGALTEWEPNEVRVRLWDVPALFGQRGDDLVALLDGLFDACEHFVDRVNRGNCGRLGDRGDAEWDCDLAQGLGDVRLGDRVADAQVRERVRLREGA